MLLVILHLASSGAFQMGPRMYLQTTNSLRSRTHQKVSMVDTLARRPIFLAAVLRLWCFWTCSVSVKHLALFVISNQQSILKRLRENTPQYQASCTCISLLELSSSFYYFHTCLTCFNQGIFKFLFFSFIFRLHFEFCFSFCLFRDVKIKMGSKNSL